jgi:hypothetical protein
MSKDKGPPRSIQTNGAPTLNRPPPVPVSKPITSTNKGK